MNKEDKATNQQKQVVVHVTSSFMGGATVSAEEVLRSSNAQQILRRAGQLRQGSDAAPAPRRKAG